jgi:predicted membrane-bound spermidine synthase
VFFLSGFAAAIYQLLWQRVLLTLYGANVESVTIVVTAFMLGLGAGSLVGGVLSQADRRTLPRLFAGAELGIAICGGLSLPVFALVGNSLMNASAFSSGLSIFLLLLVPTALMGATLPILVTYATTGSETVGRAVGGLYAINALGSAAGAAAAITVIFALLGQQRSVLLAALLNIIVAAVVVRWASTDRSST